MRIHHTREKSHVRTPNMMDVNVCVLCGGSMHSPQMDAVSLTSGPSDTHIDNMRCEVYAQHLSVCFSHPPLSDIAYICTRERASEWSRI